MTNPNYKFGKSILSADVLDVVAPCTRDLHTFFMERCEAQDESPITVALQPRTSWWLMREQLAKKVQQIPVQLSDLYDLFMLDALDLTLLRCFIL
jgi:hypothetical protein